MARPIQATPILSGKDAEIFLADLEKTKPSPVVQRYLEHCKDLYETFIAKIQQEDGDSSR